MVFAKVVKLLLKCYMIIVMAKKSKEDAVLMVSSSHVIIAGR